MLVLTAQLSHYLEGAIIGQCCFGIVYLSAYDWERNRWLVLSLVGFMLPILGIVLSASRFGIFSKFYFLDNPSFVLLPALGLYFYTARLVDIPLKRSTIYWHFLPFLLFYTVFSIIGIPSPSQFFHGTTSSLQLLINLSFVCSIYIVFYAYSYAILKLLRLNCQKYLNEYAEAPIFVTLAWIKWMVILILLITTLSGLVMLSLIFVQLESFPTILPFSSMLLTSFALSFFAFRQPTLYKEPIAPINEVEEAQKEIADNNLKTKPLSKSKQLISNTEREQLTEQLEKHLHQAQPYLNPKIRMPDLAKSLGVSPHVFSYLINEHYKMNFFSFINQHRVNYAKSLLKNENYQHYTLESIGKMSGFNSKTTFNTRFKEFVGESPNVFRKRGNISMKE